MEKIMILAQTVSVASACWAIVSGVGAWKREFIGKRKIEIAEQVYAAFLETKDAISYIRNPFSFSGEGKNRERAESETAEESAILDRAYIFFERYEKKEKVVSEFMSFKYKFMASFGEESASIFNDLNGSIRLILSAANELGSYYWRMEKRSHLSPEDLSRHIEQMQRYEARVWSLYDEDDEIEGKVRAAQIKLESLIKPVFEEPVTTYSILTKKLLSRSRH